MKFISETVPTLRSGVRKIPIVSNNDQGICEAIDEHLTNVQRLLCWNHVINAAKLWLHLHGAQAAEIPYYISCLRELFHQPSEVDYADSLQELSMQWSKAFADYYNKQIHPEVS